MDCVHRYEMASLRDFDVSGTSLLSGFPSSFDVSGTGSPIVRTV
jgi:hypothetical protein